ncbi:MAG: nucleoside hydrolase [Oscillospiraceae bacterium]|nr:nucleoside hydrolase [Oscillospiraceae bacterium]
MEKIKVIMDVDTGIDDAIAMCLALGNEKIDVLGFTTTYGNRPLNLTTENTLEILELIGRTDVPVAVGAHKPIIKEYNAPAFSVVHGYDGLGDMENPLPNPVTKPLDISAVEFMARKLRESDTPVTLVPVGPMTNVATLILTHPELMDKIEQVVLMGGTTMKGNASAVAEANIITDPEAAHILFKSGLKIKMAGLDATWKGYIGFDEMDDFAAQNWLTKTIHSMCGIYAEHYRDRMKNPGMAMHDSLTIAWLINPDVVKAEDYYVTVDIDGRYTYGMTVTDVNNVLGKPANASVAMGVDREPFIQLIYDAMAKLAAEKQ